MSESAAQPRQTPATRREPLEAPIRAVVLAAALVVVGLLFPRLASLAVVVLATVVIALPLTVWTDRCERLGLPRALGAISGMLLALACVALVVVALAPSFSREIRDFVDAVPGAVDDLQSGLRDATGAQPGEVSRRLESLLGSYVDHPLRLLGPAASVGLGVLGVIGGVLIVLLTAIFIAVNPRPLVDGVLRMLPPARRPHAARTLGRLRAAYLGWLRGLAVAMVLIGVLVYAGLKIVGLQYAVAFAVLSALFEVVPYYGALASGIPAVLYALTISPGKALAVAIVFVVAHQIDGNIISPLVMARAAKLHPAVIAVGVIVAGRVFGLLGLIMAVPLIATFLIVVEEAWIRPNEERAPPADAAAQPDVSARRQPDAAEPDAAEPERA